LVIFGGGEPTRRLTGVTLPMRLRVAHELINQMFVDGIEGDGPRVFRPIPEDRHPAGLVYTLAEFHDLLGPKYVAIPRLKPHRLLLFACSYFYPNQDSDPGKSFERIHCP
ncbi:MAG TPA: hypothetical protein P5307_03705, partial [Pirellulaceae bacterium]|nr:hypothetical protein [Pirellulaceae bacterium]